MEHILNFLHRLVGHTLRGEAHALGAEVDHRGLVQNVGLVECIHDVLANGTDTMLLPHHHVVVLNLFQGGFGQFHAAWKFVRHDAEAQWRKCECLGNHAP